MEFLPRTDRDGIEQRKNSAELECQVDQMEKEITGSGQSSVVQSGGKLFLTSADREGGLRFIHCLDKDTGEILWKRKSRIPRKKRFTG